MWVGKLFGIVIPDSILHLASKSSTDGSWLPSSCLRMSDCKARVPTADARKAGIASDDTLRIPRPPIAIGRVDCIHCVSVRLIFKIYLLFNIYYYYYYYYYCGKIHLTTS